MTRSLFQINLFSAGVFFCFSTTASSARYVSSEILGFWISTDTVLSTGSSTWEGSFVLSSISERAGWTIMPRTVRFCEGRRSGRSANILAVSAVSGDSSFTYTGYLLDVYMHTMPHLLHQVRRKACRLSKLNHKALPPYYPLTPHTIVNADFDHQVRSGVNVGQTHQTLDE